MPRSLSSVRACIYTNIKFFKANATLNWVFCFIYRTDVGIEPIIHTIILLESELNSLNTGAGLKNLCYRVKVSRGAILPRW